jgi:hypothetical protein
VGGRVAGAARSDGVRRSLHPESVEADQRMNAMASSAGSAYAVGYAGSIWKQEGAARTKQTGRVGTQIIDLPIDDCGRGLAIIALAKTRVCIPSDFGSFQ